jgi:hypothetical protein
MTPIQKQIRIQLGDRDEITAHDVLIFVGMIEGGEAEYADFYDVGGCALVAAVAYNHGCIDAERKQR